MTDLKKLITQDGSITFYNNDIGDIYHSDVGAYTEALEKFIYPSKIMEKLDNYSCINVLDVCFGLGYNTKVLINSIFQADPLKKINIIAIEIDPYIIQKSTEIEFVNYDCHLKDFFNNFLHKVYYTTVSSQYNQLKYFEDSYRNITFKMYINDVRQVLAHLDINFDLILHDPFCPNKLPELWTTQIFQHLSRLLNDEGMLLTYSSSSSVRGAMKKSGLNIGNTKPVGRRTPGTIASNNKANIEYSLTKYENELLESTAGIPYEDEDMTLCSNDIIKNREKRQAESSRITSTTVRNKYKNLSLENEHLGYNC